MKHSLPSRLVATLFGGVLAAVKAPTPKVAAKPAQEGPRSPFGGASARSVVASASASLPNTRKFAALRGVRRTSSFTAARTTGLVMTEASAR